MLLLKPVVPMSEELCNDSSRRDSINCTRKKRSSSWLIFGAEVDGGATLTGQRTTTTLTGRCPLAMC